MAIPSWADTTATVDTPPAWDDTLSSGGDVPPSSAKTYPLSMPADKPVRPISKNAYNEALTSYLSGNRAMAIAKAKVAYAADNNNIEARNMLERMQRSSSAGTTAFGFQRDQPATTPKSGWNDAFKDLGEAAKDAYTAIDTSAPVRTIGAGSARVMAQAARVPNLASNLFSLPYNAAAQMAGRGDLAFKSPRLFEKEAAWWDEKANQISEGVQRWGSKGEDFISVLKRGNKKEVAEYIAYKVLEEAPQQAIVIGSTLAGMPNAALAYMGISSAAQAQSEGEKSLAGPAAITANAVINGTLEAALERTPALLGKWSKALEYSFGKQGKMQILKNVSKTIGSSIIQEGPIEEGSTEFLQSLAAQATGVNPNAMSGVGNRMLEASVIGGAMGAGMTAPTAIGAGFYQNGQNVAPLDLNQGSEYLAGYGTAIPGDDVSGGPSGPSSAVAPPVFVPGDTLDVVFPGGAQQTELVLQAVAPPAERMAPQELAGNETPPPPSPSPEQSSPTPSDLVPTKTQQTKEAVRSGSATVSDEELLKFPPQDRERAKSIAEMIYAEDVQRFNREMDTYNEWRDVLGRGIKASADVSGEIQTLPLHLRNNKFLFGKTHDLIAEDALSRGLIQRAEDIFDAIKNIKKPIDPFHPDSNLSEARQIIEGEREAEAGTSIEPTWEETYEIGTEPSFFESEVTYPVGEQGDLFAAPKENIGQAYDRLIIQARKQGLSVPEAVKYAKRTLATQGRGVEAAQGGQQSTQMEMGAPGGVEGFGRGEKGQGSLFEERYSPEMLSRQDEPLQTDNAKNNASVVDELRQLEMELKSEPSNEKQSDIQNTGRASPYSITNQAPMELQYKKEGTLTFAGKTVSSPDDVAFAFRSLKNKAVEHLYAVGTKGDELVSVELISIGAIDQALAPPFEMFGLLRSRGADGFWIIHNHPSGDPKPSPQDHKLFEVLSRGLNRIGLKFKGGVVIDDTRYSYVAPSSIGEHKEFVYPGMEGKKTADVDVLKKYVEWNGPKERPVKIRDSGEVYDIVKGSQISKDSMSVLLFNNQNRVMGHATIPINAGINSIADLASKWRAPNVIISIQANSGLTKEKFSEWPRQLGDLGIRLMDVLTVKYDTYSSWRESGTFPSASVFESQAEYSVREKNGEPAVVLPNGGYVPLATMSRFKRFMREWFTTERGVGKTIDRLNEERIGKIMETAFDAPLTGKALLDYLKKNPSEDLRQGVFDALTGKRDIESLPKEIVPTVKKMRADVDALSRAVADGASPSDAMRMVIERNLGRYLGRYYKLFERKRFRPSPDVIARAKAKMREMNPNTLGMASEEEMDGIIENILTKGDVTFHRGDRRVDIPQNHFIKRKNIPKEIRDLYGEITDPTWAYLKTMSDQAVVAHNATFLNKISGVEGAFKDKPTRTHFKLIPDTARWGAVRGKYTTPEINDFLIEAIDPVDSGLFRFVEKFVVNPFKWTKTVASLPSHPRNMLGNTMFSILGSNSITNPMNAPYYWKALRIIMGREGKYRETWKEIVRARVADTQYWGSEMPKMMAEMISDPADWPNKILETAKWPIEKLGNLYNNEDLIYRVSAFLKYRDKGMTVNQAAAEVDKWFTNYARLPKGVKLARRIGVFGPFLSFKANTARILTTAAKEAAIGIKKGNPAPAMRLAFVLSFISALATLSKELFDVDEDKMKKLQDFGPVYKRNSTPIYYRTSDEKTKAFDLGYIWPTGEFQKAAKAALTGDVESFVDSIDLFQHPIFDAYSVLFNNYDTRLRRGVSNPNDPLPEQAANRMANILGQIYVPASSPIPSLPALAKGRIEPGILSGYQMKAIYDAYHGVQDRFGRTRKMPEELRAFVTGIRTWEINPEDIVKSYLFRKKGEMNEAERDMMRRVSANNLTQKERYVAAQLRESGIDIDSEEAQAFMKGNGVSDSDSRRRIVGVNVDIKNFKRRQEKIRRDVKGAVGLLKEINKGETK